MGRQRLSVVAQSRNRVGAQPADALFAPDNSGYQEQSPASVSRDTPSRLARTPSPEPHAALVDRALDY
jgi:hypothetical protein